VIGELFREELRAGQRPEQRQDELLTLSKAAALIDVGTSTIRAWMKSGRLPRVGEGKTVRVRRADVLNALSQKSADREIERLADAALGRL
jgi:excisionase family DNA binding protein